MWDTRRVRRALQALLVLTLPIAAPPVAVAEIQATKLGILQWLEGVCERGINDAGRKAAAARNMTVAEVCDCFATDMWRRYPTIHWWVQETTPYEWNKVTADFPKALAKCVTE